MQSGKLCSLAGSSFLKTGPAVALLSIGYAMPVIAGSLAIGFAMWTKRKRQILSQTVSPVAAFSKRLGCALGAITSRCLSGSEIVRFVFCAKEARSSETLAQADALHLGWGDLRPCS